MMALCNGLLLAVLYRMLHTKLSIVIETRRFIQYIQYIELCNKINLHVELALLKILHFANCVYSLVLIGLRCE